MEHGLLAIALYKLANICKLLSSCGFFRLESFQLTHYIRVCKFDSKQLTLYCKLLKFWNLRSMHASYPLLWIDWFFLNCLFFIIRNSFFNEFDGACFFIKLFLPHFKNFHLENCRFDSLGFFSASHPQIQPLKTSTKWQSLWWGLLRGLDVGSGSVYWSPSAHVYRQPDKQHSLNYCAAPLVCKVLRGEKM